MILTLLLLLQIKCLAASAADEVFTGVTITTSVKDRSITMLEAPQTARRET